MSKETKIAERFLVQVPDDLDSVSKLPLAKHIAKITLRPCGKPPKGTLIEETKLVEIYGIKAKKLAIPETEYFIINARPIEEPDIALLNKTYNNMKANPRIKAMQIHDGADGKIVWRAGYHHLTAIARNGGYLNEEQALALAKEVGGHVCRADAIKRTLDFEIIKCVKT